MKKRLAGVVIAALFFTGPLFTNSAQAADNCKADRFGSNSFSGLKFRCPDGGTLTIKPDLRGSYTNPWTTYNAKDNYGNTTRCKYNNIWKRYDCK